MVLGLAVAAFLTWRLVMTRRLRARCDTSNPEVARRFQEQFLIFERAPVGIMTLDLQGIIRSFNPKMVELSGAARAADMIGQNFLEMPPCRDTRLKGHIEGCFIGQAFDVEMACHAHPSGKPSWRHYRGVPLVETGGKKVYGILLIVTDITQRKQLEREHLSVFAKNAPVIVFAVNREGVYTLHEGQALANVGLHPGEAVGRRPEDVYPDAPHIAQCYHRALAGENFMVTVPLRGRIFDAWFVPTKDNGGPPTGVIGFAHDVTDQHRESEKLQLAVSLMEATLESTADGILVVDRSGKITKFNRHFIEMWRIPSEVMETGVDQKALAFVLDQLSDPDGFLGKVNELYSTPEAKSEDALEFKDGRVFERYSQPQRLNNQVVGRVWSFRDVTMRRRLEDDLKKRNAELEKTAHFLAGREKNLSELKEELQKLRRKCDIVGGEK